MKIATWNVNSIKARRAHVEAWLAEQRPDVLMIQELKGENFTAEEFGALGYGVTIVGQKAYNGVATLARHPIEILLDRLPGDETDEQARYLETRINGIRFINIYLPNGNPVDTEKFSYKLRWMDRLHDRIAALRNSRENFVLAGDFNVIPEERDCHDPAAWANDALFRLESRRAFRRLVNLGLTDAFRVFNDDGGQYTFWDYQAGAWPRNHGIRIDHILLSPGPADRLHASAIDKNPRGMEKASDHTPILAEIDV